LLKGKLKDQIYSGERAKQWSDELCAQSLAVLQEISPNFKYMGKMRCTLLAFLHVSAWRLNMINNEVHLA
jgi:hypothetical protein